MSIYLTTLVTNEEQIITIYPIDGAMGRSGGGRVLGVIGCLLTLQRYCWERHSGD